MEALIFIVFVIFFGIAAFYLARKRHSKDRDLNSPEYIEKSVSLFQAEIKPFLEKLNPPHNCSEAAEGLRQLRTRYLRMLKLVNRYPKVSEEYKLIFSQTLQPVLDKLSYATTDRECFKNRRFKKAFDRFIRVAQKHAESSDRKI